MLRSRIIEEAKYKRIFYFKNFYNKKTKSWFHGLNSERYFVTFTLIE